MAHQWRYLPTQCHQSRYICRKCKTEILGTKPNRDMLFDVPITLLTEHDRRGLNRAALYTCEELVALEAMLS